MRFIGPGDNFRHDHHPLRQDALSCANQSSRSCRVLCDTLANAYVLYCKNISLDYCTAKTYHLILKRSPACPTLRVPILAAPSSGRCPSPPSDRGGAPLARPRPPPTTPPPGPPLPQQPILPAGAEPPPCSYLPPPGRHPSSSASGAGALGGLWRFFGVKKCAEKYP